MIIEPFNFSIKVNKLNMYQHLCYYHNEANDNLNIINEDRKKAKSNLNELYHLLRKEYKEYDKAKNSNYILSDGIYAQYVSNISDAYTHCMNVNHYDDLLSNLYDIYNYMTYGFEEIFCMDDKNKFDENDINDYLYKVCCIELKNKNIYFGKVDIKIHDGVDDKDESISVFFLDKWHQIMLEDIDKIKIIED